MSVKIICLTYRLYYKSLVSFEVLTLTEEGSVRLIVGLKFSGYQKSLCETGPLLLLIYHFIEEVNFYSGSK